MPYVQHMPLSLHEWVPCPTRYFALLIMVMHRLSKDWCVENPVQRSDITGSWKRYLSAKFELHGSLWQMPCMVELMRVTGAVVTSMPMCFFDPEGPQKYTTVLISKGLAAAASAMTRARCTHDKHKKIAVGLEHSRASQVYPSPFCEAWARVMRWPDDACACKAVLSHLALGVAKPSLPNPLIGLWNLDAIIPCWDFGSFVHISARRFIRPIYRLSCACNVMELSGIRSPV